MFITALCPTFRKVEQLQNCLWCWEQQTYPKDKRMLVILDDAGTFDTQAGDDGTWKLVSEKDRHPNMPSKYRKLLSLAPPQTEAFLVWDDDDIYLPWYVESIAAVLGEHELARPQFVLTEYPGQVQKEPVAGKFHSSLGFRAELLMRVGGWPETDRADFDLQLISRLERNATSIGDPFKGMPIQFIYVWNTGAAHCQWSMQSPGDTEWYRNAEHTYKPVPRAGRLVAKQSKRCQEVIEMFAASPW